MLDQKITDYSVYFEDPQRANFLSKVVSAIFMSSQSILSTVHIHIHMHSHTCTHSHICTTYPHYLLTQLCKYPCFLKFTCNPQLSTLGTFTVICGHAISCHQMCTFQVKVEQGNTVFLISAFFV